MAETRSQALLKNAGGKELDGIIANRFDAIEKEMREMNEKREEETRQIMMALAKISSQSIHQPSMSQTFDNGVAQETNEHRGYPHMHSPTCSLWYDKILED